MENNGLITYRDSYLYVSEDSGLHARRYSGLVITHEMSHFYFGNLVTMKWWDDLWLNESFATAVMYLIAEVTHKRLQDVEYFEPMQYFIDGVKVAGMNLDSLESTHPVKSVITKPDLIETIFDEISYNKGAAVIMQLIDYVGEESFFAGIRNYLSKFKNSNADSNDLWNCLSETCNQDIAEIMDHWILKIGFPMVRVQYDEKVNQITFNQTQYKLSCSSSSGYYAKRDSNHYCLPINISLRYKSGLISTNKILMNSSSALIDLDRNEKLEAINVNTGCKSLM
ncbi:MAG: peptide catabolic process, partial [Paramarteilia canceri]